MFKALTVQKLRCVPVFAFPFFLEVKEYHFSLCIGDFSAFHLFLSPLVFQIPNLNSAIPFLSFIVL